MDWFLYDNSLRHERVKKNVCCFYIKAPISFLIRGLYENTEYLVKDYFFYFLINPLSDALSFKNLEKI